MELWPTLKKPAAKPTTQPQLQTCGFGVLMVSPAGAAPATLVARLRAREPLLVLIADTWCRRLGGISTSRMLVSQGGLGEGEDYVLRQIFDPLHPWVI